MKTLVVGLGNPILTDDGVGVKVAYAVEEALRSQTSLRSLTSGDDITVTEASVGGLRLMELMVGYDRVIIIDAIIHPNGNKHKAGTIFQMSQQDLEDISLTQHSASAHDTTLNTALDMAARMGLHLPKEVLIFAVEVEEIFVFSDEPTPAVAAAIPKVTEMVLEELRISSA
ncbi:MAG: hydrogenase maturation protease [Anaerolineales bacterium]|nr:hydrogenase maturation protease [Anaerolineales bacterium]